MERPQISENTYYDMNATAAVKAADAIRWNFSSLVILYESVSLAKQELMDRMKKQSVKYFVDLPKITMQKVPGSVMHTESSVTLPPGTKVAVITWMKSMQLFHQKTKNKNLSARFHFPRRAAKATFELENQRAPLLFDHGIISLGTTDGPGSTTCMEYHRSLVQRKLYSGSFSKMFPPTHMSSDQVIIIDLSDKELKHPTSLKINVWYTDDLSEEGWYMVTTTIQQGMLTLREKQAVTCEILV